MQRSLFRPGLPPRDRSLSTYCAIPASPAPAMLPARLKLGLARLRSQEAARRVEEAGEPTGDEPCVHSDTRRERYDPAIEQCKAHADCRAVENMPPRHVLRGQRCAQARTLDRQGLKQYRNDTHVLQ